MCQSLENGRQRETDSELGAWRIKHTLDLTAQYIKGHARACPCILREFAYTQVNKLYYSSVLCQRSLTSLIYAGFTPRPLTRKVSDWSDQSHHLLMVKRNTHN